MILRRHRLKIQLQKRFPDQVRKGINIHDYFIKKYAYSADKIRKYITGEEPYKGEKLVFLTFDDGVNNQITPQVLDTLKKHNVHATFFLVGNTLTSENQNIVKREVAEGHSIGFHSSTHDYATLYPNGIVNTEEIQAEIADMENSLKKYWAKHFKQLSGDTQEVICHGEVQKNLMNYSNNLASIGLTGMRWLGMRSR